jgi:hypothetical protein
MQPWCLVAPHTTPTCQGINGCQPWCTWLTTGNKHCHNPHHTGGPRCPTPANTPAPIQGWSSLPPFLPSTHTPTQVCRPLPPLHHTLVILCQWSAGGGASCQGIQALAMPKVPVLLITSSPSSTALDRAASWLQLTPPKPLFCFTTQPPEALGNFTTHHNLPKCGNCM